MTKPSARSKVDAYFQKAKTWQKELQELRGILLDCDLTEELKWGNRATRWREAILASCSPEVIFGHYRELVTPDEAKAWLSVRSPMTIAV
jgi:hypothetical protein